MSEANIVRLPTSTEKSFRQAPANVEIEQALLGALLVNSVSVIDRVSEFLRPEHFYQPLHKRIFEIILSMSQSNKTITPISVKTYLQTGDVPDLDVPRYLAGLAAEAVTVINAEDYARALYDLAMRRALIEIGEEVVTHSYDAGVEQRPNDLIEEAEKRLYELAEKGRTSGGFQAFGQALTTAISMASAAFHRDGQLSGLSTGLTDLDAKLGGLQKSDLIILAGRPGMGKSALATNIGFNIAKAFKPQTQSDGSIKAANGGRVAFFSLEMSAEQLATRILAEQSGIPSEEIRRGKINEDEFATIVQVSQDMTTIPFYIDQTGGISIAQLATRARRLKRQKGMELLIVDYLQLLTGSSRKSSENRVQEITEITTGLKALAKELDVPVIALSQLSRQVENREDKRPQLSDLRESGSIEQDADVVMFVYREDYYLMNKKPREGTEEFFKWQTEMEGVIGRAEAIIGKQRHGPTGTVELHFDGRITKFSNLALEDRLPAHRG
jgi:replicative DNA helicase